MQDSFTKEKTRCLKGIAAIGVVLNHLSFEQNTLDIMNRIFYGLGPLFVAVFFFISGYGICKGLIEKGEREYCSYYLKNKLPKLLIPYFSLFFAYMLSYQIMGSKISIQYCFMSLINGHSIVRNSWYVYAIIYFDLLICFIAILFSKKWLRFLSIFMGLNFYVFMIYWKDLGGHWIASISAFLFGILCAYTPNIFDFLVRHRKKICFSICILIIVLESTLDGVLNINITEFVWLILHWIKAISVSVICIYACYYIRFGKISKFLGKISYELYLIHGFVISVFINEHWHIKNGLILLGLVLGTSLIAAYIWKKVNNFFYYLVLERRNNKMAKSF